MNIHVRTGLKVAAFAVLAIAGVAVATFTMHNKPAHAAACQTPGTNYGSASVTLTVPEDGTYYLWSRVMAPDTTRNSYLLEVDGTTCHTVGDAGIPSNTWTWVDYKDGSQSSRVSQTLKAGAHTIRLIGREASVKVDRILAISDAACKPTGIGDNCGAATDTTPPSAAITAPANAATVSGTVNVTATAADNTSISKVEFYINNTLKLTDTNPPYSYSWNTASGANGTYTVTIKAYDGAGNNATDARTVTVKNGDTAAPSAPGNLKATASAYNKVSLTWTASTDNIAVASYTIFRNGATLGTATGTSYQDTTTAPQTTYSYKVVAYDAANNASPDSNTVSVVTPSVPDTQAPSVPGNVSAAAVSSSQIDLTWAASTDNIGVAGYDIYRAVSGGQAAKIATSQTTRFGDTGLAVNTRYSYYVIAKDTANNASGKSASAEALTLDEPQEVADGRIRGKITGRNGRALSGAKVTIMIDGVRYRATTNANGVYRMYDIPVGQHTIKVKASGYQERTARVNIYEDELTITNLRLIAN